MTLGPKTDPARTGPTLTGQVVSHSFSGSTVTYALDSAAGPLLAQVPFRAGEGHPFPNGDTVQISWAADTTTVIPG